MELTINGVSHRVPPSWQQESLLSFIHEQLGLTGMKFGCGAGLCGACTVLLDGQAQRSCVLPVGQAAGHEIRRIEGLADGAGKLHPVQQAWLDERVPQCGYCQAGQIMSTVALLNEHPRPTPDQVDSALAGNLCRCGTHQRIRAAIVRAAGAAR